MSAHILDNWIGVKVLYIECRQILFFGCARYEILKQTVCDAAYLWNNKTENQFNLKNMHCRGGCELQSMH